MWHFGTVKEWQWIKKINKCPVHLVPQSCSMNEASNHTQVLCKLLCNDAFKKVALLWKSSLNCMDFM